MNRGEQLFFLEKMYIGLKKPEFDTSEGFKLIIWRITQDPNDGEQPTGQPTGQASEGARRVILVLQSEMKSAEIQGALELKHSIPSTNPVFTS